MQFKKIRIRKAAGKKKSQGGQNALNKLNSFLNAASAEPAYILHSTWTNQQNAITYCYNRQEKLAKQTFPVCQLTQDLQMCAAQCDVL